tara:strand:- start:463 stop:894 length:432 start_codon:yes stop_codon:yes gene_type:complete
MKKSIDQAAEDFVSSHKAGILDLEHIQDGYGSVAGFLSKEGQPHGAFGEWSMEIKAHQHKDGRVDTVEWYQDTFQIAHYRLPFADRVTPEDHTPEINFDPDFGISIERIIELKAKGYSDISLDEVVEGVVVESVAIEDYLEQK